MDFNQIAKVNMETWLNVLLSRDPKKVAELYCEGNSFLPTVSGDFKKGVEGAEDYFKHFLAKNPEGKVTEEVVHELGDNAYLHVGMYTFVVDGEGDRQEVSARFTYLWQKQENGEWKICHHHSSVRP